MGWDMEAVTPETVETWHDAEAVDRKPRAMCAAELFKAIAVRTLIGVTEKRCDG